VNIILTLFISEASSELSKGNKWIIFSVNQIPSLSLSPSKGVSLGTKVFLVTEGFGLGGNCCELLLLYEIGS
jgi:hypothetical protein